jgi:hypothetical protein
MFRGRTDGAKYAESRFAAGGMEVGLFRLIAHLGAPSLTFFLGETNVQGWDNGILSQLLVELQVWVAIVTVVVVAVNDNHDLRLRRIGHCEAEDEHETEQNLFHALVWRAVFKNTELL